MIDFDFDLDFSLNGAKSSQIPLFRVVLSRVKLREAVKKKEWVQLSRLAMSPGKLSGAGLRARLAERVKHNITCAGTTSRRSLP